MISRGASASGSGIMMSQTTTIIFSSLSSKKDWLTPSSSHSCNPSWFSSSTRDVSHLWEHDDLLMILLLVTWSHDAASSHPNIFVMMTAEMCCDWLCILIIRSNIQSLSHRHLLCYLFDEISYEGWWWKKEPNLGDLLFGWKEIFIQSVRMMKMIIISWIWNRLNHHPSSIRYFILSISSWLSVSIIFHFHFFSFSPWWCNVLTSLSISSFHFVMFKSGRKDDGGKKRRMMGEKESSFSSALHYFSCVDGEREEEGAETDDDCITGRLASIQEEERGSFSVFDPTALSPSSFCFLCSSIPKDQFLCPVIRILKMMKMSQEERVGSKTAVFRSEIIFINSIINRMTMWTSYKWWWSWWRSELLSNSADLNAQIRRTFAGFPLMMPLLFPLSCKNCCFSSRSRLLSRLPLLPMGSMICEVSMREDDDDGKDRTFPSELLVLLSFSRIQVQPSDDDVQNMKMMMMIVSRSRNSWWKRFTLLIIPHMIPDDGRMYLLFRLLVVLRVLVTESKSHQERRRMNMDCMRLSSVGIRSSWRCRWFPTMTTMLLPDEKDGLLLIQLLDLEDELMMRQRVPSMRLVSRDVISSSWEQNLLLLSDQFWWS